MQKTIKSPPTSVSNTTQKRKVFRLNQLTASVIATFGLATIPLSLAAQENTPQWAAEHILVKAVPGLDDTKLEQILSRNGGHSVARIQQIGVHIVKVPAQAEEQVVAALSHNPNIEFAELDMRIGHEEFIPDDPKFGSQWHHNTMNSSFAWDTTAGAGVTVAILDTGVDGNHSDLQANLLPGWNSASQNTDWADIQGHGTMTAGTVGAIANNTLGVAGMAWNVSILPVRITNDSTGYAYFSDIARGLTWAADNGANVANISYGVSGSFSVSNAANYMKSKGGLTVASAGNGSVEIVLSDNADIISVSATDSADNLTSWSSWGNFVDVSAPGVSIWTTKNGNTYGAPSGTSFSSPLTAGVAALIMAANPSLTPDEVEQILESSTLDRGTVGWDNKYGHGRVDAGAAVLAAINTQPVIDNTAPVVSMSLIDGQIISGLISITANASDDVGMSHVELHIDGNKIASDSSAPFTFAWDSTSFVDGNHTIEVKAVDTSGNVSSVSVIVTVSNPVVEDLEAPSTNITSHSDGDLVSGNVKINITANDNIGVAMLSCYIDGSLVSVTNDVTDMTCTWNTRKESSGSHIIEARAEDAAGNQATHSINLIVGSDSNNTGGGTGKGKNK